MAFMLTYIPCGVVILNNNIIIITIIILRLISSIAYDIIVWMSIFRTPYNCRLFISCFILRLPIFTFSYYYHHYYYYRKFLNLNKIFFNYKSYDSLKKFRILIEIQIGNRVLKTNEAKDRIEAKCAQKGH